MTIDTTNMLEDSKHGVNKPNTRNAVTPNLIAKLILTDDKHNQKNLDQIMQDSHKLVHLISIPFQ